jgi:mannose-6-phosphate isomerase-like protein (cupin superfamily)
MHYKRGVAGGALALCACCIVCAGRQVDPTFLHRFLPDVPEKQMDVTTSTCHYKPVFGAGDAGAGILRGVARFGEMTVDAHGASELVTYPAEEQVYVILDGIGLLHYGSEKIPVRKNDFLYLPPGIRHGISNPSNQSCRLVVMGFKVPASPAIPPPPKALLANIDDVKKQTVGGHPASTLYQLLMGDARSTRDKIAAGRVLTSLFIMSVEPGGTNFPHHHEQEEEIYLLLEGEGEIVAGSGVDGVEGRYPARPGDAYFYRLNCTVGFYNSSRPGAKAARILAVRSLFPFRQDR